MKETSHNCVNIERGSKNLKLHETKHNVHLYAEFVFSTNYSINEYVLAIVLNSAII